jgi:hypothetical protein
MPNSLTMPHGPIDRRRQRRIQVLLAVEVQGDEVPQVAKLVELSSTGARLLTSRPLLADQRVILRRAGVELQARVAWGRGIAAGVEFATPLDERSFLRMRRGHRDSA